ncbi:CidA/LrgA family protein [Acinetobacter populi]|jgi:holin-like protein|uniref:CidA/LrgA family protein n=2 Tax=Acinetobacter TaxID=469 RepID=A0A1Z9Z1G6_9GAMM|nr:CidA/LrgA family protein [Acinetobacter populi]MCH4246279.1 CidA/LrgA family protein [Acinetobacter populi]OUY08331.1 CidA/LrgA family protein [Acinetobacter populi]
MNLSQNYFKSLVRLIGQLALLAGFWLIGDVLNKVLNIPISSGILGMFVLLACLLLGIIKIQYVETGAQVILRELVLFFLPIVVAVVQYKELFMTEGWQLVLSIGVGTMLVMVSTSLTIHYLYRFKKYWHVRKRLHHIDQP